MTKHMDAVLALDAAEPLPFLAVEPIAIADGIEIWPLGTERCFWWLRSTVDAQLAAALSQVQTVIISDDQSAVCLFMAQLRRRWGV